MHAENNYDASTIFSMIEVGPEELGAALKKLGKAKSEIEIIDQREEGLYDVYLLNSGTSLYEVARLGFFYWCNCGDFRFSHTACKHQAFVFPQVCIACFDTPVGEKGETCGRCESAARKEEMSNAPYLKVPSNYKPERIGSVRI